MYHVTKASSFSLTQTRACNGIWYPDLPGTDTLVRRESEFIILPNTMVLVTLDKYLVNVVEHTKIYVAIHCIYIQCIEFNWGHETGEGTLLSLLKQTICNIFLESLSASNRGYTIIIEKKPVSNHNYFHFCYIMQGDHASSRFRQDPQQEQQTFIQETNPNQANTYSTNPLHTKQPKRTAIHFLIRPNKTWRHY